MDVNLTQLNLKYQTLKDSDKTAILLYCNNTIKEITLAKVWDASIKAVIVTDDFNNDVLKQAEEWKIETKISNSKEYTVVAKTLSNKNFDDLSQVIFIEFNLFLETDLQVDRIITEQALKIYFGRFIPQSLREFNLYPDTLDNYISLLISEWCEIEFATYIISSLKNIKNDFVEPSKALIGFKRGLKKYLYLYNSDGDHDTRFTNFWHNYFGILNTLIKRLLERPNHHSHIQDDESCKPYLKDIIDQIILISNQFRSQSSYDFALLKQAIINFSNVFNVHLFNNGITLDKNPKDYFINEIIEAEPRIVCFIDILGFSDLIERYDTDETSTLLQDIQESFEIAINSLLQNTNLRKSEAVKYLEYKTFSDNIVISIPFFDNQEDFLSNFNILAIYVRALQYTMMNKKFYMRGGISIGSYYADKNIIFSKGLVNAYYLESKKAIYPRVVIDKNIIEKLLKYDSSRIKYYMIERYVMFDWENTAFLNPFNLSEYSITQFKNAFGNIEVDETDPLLSSIQNLSKSMISSLMPILEASSESEKQLLNIIEQDIINNINFYQENENIVQKYWWLLQFLKWIKKDSDSNLKFKYFEEFLKN